MNIRKPTDYITMFTTLDTLMAAQLPQMELYREIGRVVSDRSEKGAAVAASEYLQATYPTAEGFSPRNLRRMRAFYAAYEESPETMRLAMNLGWTQNVAILERCSNNDERAWYIRAVLRFGWKKAKLLDAIESQAWLYFLHRTRSPERFLFLQYSRKPSARREKNAATPEILWLPAVLLFSSRSAARRGCTTPVPRCCRTSLKSPHFASSRGASPAA